MIDGWRRSEQKKEFEKCRDVRACFYVVPLSVIPGRVSFVNGSRPEYRPCGEAVIKARFTEAEPILGDLARVRQGGVLKQDGEWGLINRPGECVCRPSSRRRRVFGERSGQQTRVTLKESLSI